jgi:hypothetical protein
MRSAKARTKLQWSDAWVLLAVIGASRNRESAPLAEIIAHADYINHAIVTRDELELGVRRLAAERYLRKAKSGFKPSAKTERLWQQSASKEKRVWGALERVVEAIGASAWEPGPLPTTVSEKHVSKSSYERALAEYLGRVPHSHSPRGRK